MILKNRKIPPELLQLESLLQRVPNSHPHHPVWTEKLRRINAGFNGEQKVDTLWNEIPLPPPHYFIHDLFIQTENSSYQIDSILITQQFVLILEIKSISGLLNFDSQTRQFSRTNKDGTIDGMRNPDDQVRRHEKWMRSFLNRNGFTVPVIGVIVFTYPTSVIQSKAEHRITIQSSGLPYLIEKLTIDYHRMTLSESNTKLLAAKLLSCHSEKPLKTPYSSAALLTGVFCLNCPGQKMHYYRKKWTCTSCYTVNCSAHIAALKQYRLLVGPTITNREFRAFIDLPSAVTVSKMLNRLNMDWCGSFKDRVHHIPDQIWSKESIPCELESK